jgi:hypothetical protein
VDSQPRARKNIFAMIRHLMKKFLTLLIFLTFAFSLYAQSVPSLINYQGRLTDESGSPLPDGTYRLAFRFYTHALPASTEPLIWGQQQDVSIRAGTFNVVLGAPGAVTIAGAAVNDFAYAFTDQNRYVELQVVTDVGNQPVSRTILPRQQFMNSPYTFIPGGLVQDQANAFCPPGTIIAFGVGASAAPPGWSLCDGAAYEIGKYTRLYGTIGGPWGNDGAGTFRLADLRGVFLRGVNASRNDAFRDPVDRVSLSGGNSEQIGSFQMDAFKRHRHSYKRATFHILGAQGLAIGTNETRPKNEAVNYFIKD